MKKCLLIIGIIAGVMATLSALFYIDRSIFRKDLLASIKDNDCGRLEKIIASRKGLYSLDFYDKNEDIYDTPLYLAISLEYPVHRNDFKMVRLLLQSGANPNLLTKANGRYNNETFQDKMSLLGFIIGELPTTKHSRTDIEMITYLLAHGADPNLGYIRNDIPCNTPLMSACLDGDFEIVTLLLRYHADVNFSQQHSNLKPFDNDKECDVLDGAMWSRHIQNENDRYEIVKLFFAHGYDLSERCTKDPLKLESIKKFIAENKKLNPQLATYLEEKIKELGSKNAKKH